MILKIDEIKSTSYKPDKFKIKNKIFNFLLNVNSKKIIKTYIL